MAAGSASSPAAAAAAPAAAAPAASVPPDRSSTAGSTSGSGRPPAPLPPAWRVLSGNLAAGAVAGCAVEAALYPIDTIKTRAQAAIGGGGLRSLLASGGGRRLYAGVAGNLAGVAPATALFIGVYESVKVRVASTSSEQHSFLPTLAAAASAAAASSLIRVPTEVVKSRLQTGEFRGVGDAVRSIVAREGLVRGMYAGYSAFLLRDLPFDAIEFVSYEQLKRVATAWAGRELGPGETSVIGAAAGGLTGIVTTPLDVLKTRLMTQGSSGRYRGLLHATSEIMRTEGPSAFMAGWQPRLLWVSLGGFVFFPVLETSKAAFAPAHQHA
ncbi:hypothetical protein FOA52_003509 [Chlamydomonas sp. UWO 241]|nr:hypothetical protein FOA52_003509 [Chlamydomonas sp. UWO 241]